MKKESLKILQTKFYSFNSPKPNQTKHLSHVAHIHDQTLIIDSVALALKKPPHMVAPKPQGRILNCFKTAKYFLDP